MGLIGIFARKGDIYEIITYLFSVAIVLLLVMPIHECAHGFIASKLGDPTPRYEGRLTLNPKAHLNYIGILSMILIGFGAANPVRVDSRYFDKPKRDMALVAMAGPLSNLIFAFIACFIEVSLVYIPLIAGVDPIGFPFFVLELLAQIFFYVALLNINLALFNLIPIPPLDGSKILFAILPDRVYWKVMRYERYFYFALLFLIFFSDSFSGILTNLIYNVLRVFYKVVSWPYGFFL